MIGVVFYGLVVALLLGLAALSVEKAFALRKWPRRGVWLSSMLLSVLLPLWMSTQALPGVSRFEFEASTESAAASTSAATARGSDGSSRADAAGTPSAILDAGLRVVSATLAGAGARLDRAFPALWVVASLTLAIAFGATWLRVHLRARPWPQWLLDCPSVTQALVLAHERQHIAARDPMILLISLSLLLLLPWNLPLWWQFRRLRLAVEVDCDARVLRDGVDAQTYGRQLLELGERLSAVSMTTVALIERTSQLEFRVRAPVTGKWRRPWFGLSVWFGLAALLAMMAYFLDAPPATMQSGMRAQARAAAADDARVRRAAAALVRMGTADSLAAAAVIPVYGDLAKQSLVPSDSQARLALMARATALAPDRADLAFLQLGLCAAWLKSCDKAALTLKLHKLDPDNGVVWLDALSAAYKINDSGSVRKGLSAIADSKYVDLYWTRLGSHLTAAIAGGGGLQYPEAMSLILGGLSTITLSVFQPVTQICQERPANEKDLLEICRKVATAFRNGDTLIAEMIGAGMAKRLWPKDSTEYQDAYQDRCTHYYEARTSMSLRFRDLIFGGLQRQLRVHRQNMALFRKEQDATHADFLSVREKSKPAVGDGPNALDCGY